MARLLIRVGDDTHADDWTNSQLLKHGDVVAVAEDSHVWGSDELSLPLFRNIQVPGPRSDYMYLLDKEPAEVEDRFPPVFSAIRRNKLKLINSEEVRGKYRRPRNWKLSDTNVPERKSSEQNVGRRNRNALDT